MSFLQVQKFPPSLQYILATAGILLLLYAAFDDGVEQDWRPRLRAVVEVYGRVPFLFYVLHIYLLHAVTVAVSFATHGNWPLWIGPGKFWGGESPENWGYGLPVLYFIWIAVVLALHMPCRWFSDLKARRRDWWLSYL